MADESVNQPAASAPHPDSLTDEQLEAIARGGESEKPSLFDRLLDQICTLECVLSVLEQETEEVLPRTSHMSAAELVLRRSIRALHEINSDVEIQQRLVKKIREVVHD